MSLEKGPLSPESWGQGFPSFLGPKRLGYPFFKFFCVLFSSSRREERGDRVVGMRWGVQ